MLFLYGLCIVVGIFIIFGFIALFAGPGGRGVPFVPTSRGRRRTMLELGCTSKGTRMADVGSGDGRLIIAFAREGIESHGFELNPILVLWTFIRIRLLGLHDKAHVHLKSYWGADLSGYDLITVFGLPPMMNALEKKLRRELPSGSIVLSNSFPFPTWTSTKKENGIYVYKK